MAELHVQTKKRSTLNSMWIWIVVVLVIAAAVIYYLANRNKNTGNPPPSHTTGFIHKPIHLIEPANRLQLKTTKPQAC